MFLEPVISGRSRPDQKIFLPAERRFPLAQFAALSMAAPLPPVPWYYPKERLITYRTVPTGGT